MEANYILKSRKLRVSFNGTKWSDFIIMKCYCLWWQVYRPYEMIFLQFCWDVDKAVPFFCVPDNSCHSLGTVDFPPKSETVSSFDSFDAIASPKNPTESQTDTSGPSISLYWNVWRRKAKLFYTSPSCKFFIHFIFHVIFVIAMSWFYLFHLKIDCHQPMEYYIAIHFAAVLAENLLGIFETDAYTINMKVKIWCQSEWNVLDMVFSTVALTAFGIPFFTSITVAFVFWNLIFNPAHFFSTSALHLGEHNLQFSREKSVFQTRLRFLEGIHDFKALIRTDSLISTFKVILNKRRRRTAIFSVKRAPKWLIEHKKWILQQKTFLTKKFSMETLTEKFRPVAFEIYEFENRQLNKINWTLSHFRLISIPFK